MSGGHYPSFNHLQPSQEYIGPRHRLPTVAPPRHTSPYNSVNSISHSPSSHTSWLNKSDYTSNYQDNTTCIPQNQNHRSAPHAQYKEDSSQQSNPPLTNSPTVGDVKQVKRMESTMTGNVGPKDDIQQELIDLSSTTLSPTVHMLSKLPNPESKTPLNGETVSEQHRTPVMSSVNLNGADINESDVEKLISNKETVVSVIAPNPLKACHIMNASVSSGSSDSRSNIFGDSDAVRLNKCGSMIVPSDNVESILETMFHTDTKSSGTTGVSSVIVSAQSCRTPPKDLRAESVEKILKSPSPKKCEDELINFEYDETANDRIRSPDMLHAKSTEHPIQHTISLNGNNTTLTRTVSKKNSDSHSDDLEKKSTSNSVSSYITKTSKQIVTITPISVDSMNSQPEQLKHEDTDEISLLEPATTNSLIITTIKHGNSIDAVSEKKVERKQTQLSVIAEVNMVCDSNPKNLSQHLSDQNLSNTSNNLNITVADGATKNQLIKNKTQNEEITYVEVESELEKMFAGIEDGDVNKGDTDPLKSLPQNSSSVLLETSQSDTSHNTTNVQHSRQSNSFNSHPVVTKINKKTNSKKIKSNNATKNLKETKTKHSISSKDYASSDNNSCKRIPVIHVQGSKENPISVQIINSIKLEDDDLSDGKISGKRKLGKTEKVTKRLAADYVVKNYDPGTSDASWVCIFCKLCAYSPGVAGEATGDLFGPYFIKNPDHIDDDTESLRHSRKVNHLEQVKKKRSTSTESSYVDSSPSTEQKTREIWVHENCIVWASGIHLIGPKLVGLDEAVSEALKTTCAHCSDKGASIGCKARHCKSCVHYSCAVHTGWKLDQDTFISTCSVHRELLEGL